MLSGFFVLLFFYFLGECISLFANVPIPGSVIGMLLLLTSLIISKRPPNHLLKISSLLLKNLSLLFIPVCTGMMFFLNMLHGQWWLLMIAIVASSSLAIIVSVITLKYSSIVIPSRWLALKQQLKLKFSNNV